jgi:tetratricopeptide (TPR) repeat protein
MSFSLGWLFSSSDIQLDEEAVRRLAETEEGENIEFKQRLLQYKDLAEYAVGIGNAGGGLLVMGVSDKKPRKLVGIPDLKQDDLKKLQLSVHNSTTIHVSPQLVKTHDGVYLLAIRIPGRPRGHVFCTQDGKYLIRVGESLVGLSSSEIAQILAESRPLPKTLTISLLAILLIALVVGALFRWHGLPSSERDSVLLGDIENLTDDRSLDDTMKLAVATKLEESPFLSVLPEERVEDALKAMRRSASERLNQALAIEVCVREGIKVAVTGSISTLGSHYVIGLRAADCQTRDSLIHEQVEVDEKENLIASVGKAVLGLRRKLGESFASSRKFDIPLEKATTHSFEAWNNFTLGNKDLMKGDDEAAIRFFKLAVQEDSDFALAYAKLAQAYDNLDENENAVKYAEEAFKRRKSVSEHENFYISARYYDIATGEVENEINTLKDWKQEYPKDWMPRSDLANDYINYYGRFDDAAEEAIEAIRLSPKDPELSSLLADALIGKGAYQDALKAIDSASAQGLDSAGLHIARFEIELLQGYAVPTLRTASWPKEEADEKAVLQEEANLAVLSGKMAVARERFHAAAKSKANRGWKESAGTVESDMAVVEAEYGDLRKAHEDMNSALAFGRKPNVMVNAALVFSLTGEKRRADDAMEELDRRFPKDTLINSVWSPVAQATQETANGQPGRSLELLESSRPYELGESAEFLPIYSRGIAYLRQKHGVHAANEFRKIIEHRGVSPISGLYPLAHLGMARALEMSGDRTGSRDSYEKFFTLWKDADPDIPILKKAKAEHAKLQ